LSTFVLKDYISVLTGSLATGYTRTCIITPLPDYPMLFTPENHLLWPFSLSIIYFQFQKPRSAMTGTYGRVCDNGWDYVLWWRNSRPRRNSSPRHKPRINRVPSSKMFS